jgi:hypothetical protein
MESLRESESCLGPRQRPISVGIEFGEFIHVFIPGPEGVVLPFTGTPLMGFDVEPSTITDFRGRVALAYLLGSAETTDGRQDLEVDVRVMQGALRCGERREALRHLCRILSGSICARYGHTGRRRSLRAASRLPGWHPALGALLDRADSRSFVPNERRRTPRSALREGPVSDRLLYFPRRHHDAGRHRRRRPVARHRPDRGTRLGRRRASGGPRRVRGLAPECARRGSLSGTELEFAFKARGRSAPGAFAELASRRTASSSTNRRP